MMSGGVHFVPMPNAYALRQCIWAHTDTSVGFGVLEAVNLCWNDAILKLKHRQSSLSIFSIEHSAFVYPCCLVTLSILPNEVRSTIPKVDGIHFSRLMLRSEIDRFPIFDECVDTQQWVG